MIYFIPVHLISFNFILFHFILCRSSSLVVYAFYKAIVFAYKCSIPEALQAYEKFAEIS